MITHPTNPLMINKNMNLHMHIMQIQGRIEYVVNTVYKYPGEAIEPYPGELYNHIGNTVNTQPGDL